MQDPADPGKFETPNCQCEKPLNPIAATPTGGTSHISPLSLASPTPPTPTVPHTPLASPTPADPENLPGRVSKSTFSALVNPTPDGEGGWLEDGVLEEAARVVEKVLKKTKEKIRSVKIADEPSANVVSGSFAAETRLGLVKDFVKKISENVAAQEVASVSKVAKTVTVRHKNSMDATLAESVAESVEILIERNSPNSKISKSMKDFDGIKTSNDSVSQRLTSGRAANTNEAVDAAEPSRMASVKQKFLKDPNTEQAWRKEKKNPRKCNALASSEEPVTELIFEKSVLPEDVEPEDPELVDGKEKKKKKKKEHKKRRRKDETTDSVSVIPVIEITDDPEGEASPERHLIPRPSLHLSPSDATAFEKPEPVAEFGPIRRPVVALTKKAPQTALMMSLVNQRKFGQTIKSVPQPVISTTIGPELSDDAVEVPVMKVKSAPSIPSELIQVRQQEKKPNSSPSSSKKKRKKKDKKRTRGDSKMAAAALSEDKSKALPTTSDRISLAAPLVIQEPIENEANGDEAEEESRKKRKKKKKKRRRTGLPGSLDKGSRKEDPNNLLNLEVPPVKVDELWGKAVGNFFVLEDVLGKGGFGEARRGRHITTGKKYAIKLERVADAESLADEYKIYQILGQRVGFPRCYYFGVGPKDNNALVMDLLGPSLEDYFRAMERKWSLKTVCMVALQVLERIEYVHSKGYVYSDIKPENFLVGLAEEKQDGIVFLIDFGLAQHFKDKETGKYCYDENLKTHPVGTMRYMSVRSHEGRSLSYRDDLESIGYLIIYFLRGRLPWQGLTMKDRQKKVKAVGLRKKNMSVEELCQDCPPEVQDYMKYVRSIQFYAEPKYERLRIFFSNILLQNKFVDDGIFDWVGNVYDFKQNKKSESVLGGKPASRTVAITGEAVVEQNPVSKRVTGETKRQTAKPPSKKPLVKTETPTLIKKAALPPLSTPPPGLAPPKSALPNKSRITSSPDGAMDPTIDPIIAFSAREAERPLRENPSSRNAPRERKTEKAKDDGPCNCC